MFVALWEFKVKSGFEEDFERTYGSNGEWAQLFANDPAYRGTRLAKDLEREGWYFTVDTWDSRTAYDVFRSVNEAAYRKLDERCGELTSEESKIGAFEL